MDPCLGLNGGCDGECRLDARGSVACSCEEEARSNTTSARVLSQDGQRCLLRTGNAGPACPKKTDFDCSDGSGCIPYEETCDGVAHCKDSSDEKERYCATLRCPLGFFKCDFGHCLPNLKRCDMESDCADGEDEAKCDCLEPEEVWKKPCPVEGAYRCNATTACISDGYNDCWDYSDERNCTKIVKNGGGNKSPSTCPPDYFVCGSGECLKPEFKCDGRYQCTDGRMREMGLRVDLMALRDFRSLHPPPLDVRWSPRLPR